MKNNKKPFKLPRGCLIAAGIVITLFIGCFGISVLQGFFAPIPSPTSTIKVIATHTFEIVPTVTLEIFATRSRW